ncbi:MAG: AAA family ATPase [Acidobacteriaceae bacterium]|nr:AAA family ATPase [Acidobacteriaceae bacterium]
MTTVELNQLNILIGPNGAGKSNLIECIALLRALPTSINGFFATGGGPDSWIRKKPENEKAAVIFCEFQVKKEVLRYHLAFSAAGHSLVIEVESLDSIKNERGTRSYFHRSSNKLLITPKPTEKGENDIEPFNASTFETPDPISPTDSIFSAYRNPFGATTIFQTTLAFAGIRIYREFQTDANSGIRKGIASNMPKHPLDESGANLALVLHEMDFHGSPMQKIKSYLRQLSDRFEDIKIRLEAGFAQVYVIEKGAGRVSATRLSDGTLKFLCLMAILCDHDPPPLVCIEEPELGLHPDALRLVAEALKEASSRMQIVITTHSDALVDYFSDEPEAILVCERDSDDSTQFKRLQRDQLQDWLEDYTLGDLWRRGGVGGTLR